MPCSTDSSITPGLIYSMTTSADWAFPGTGIKHATPSTSWAITSNPSPGANGPFGIAIFMTPPLVPSLTLGRYFLQKSDIFTAPLTCFFFMTAMLFINRSPWRIDWISRTNA